MLNDEQLEKAKSLLFIELSRLANTTDSECSINNDDDPAGNDGPPKLKRFRFGTLRRSTTPVPEQPIRPTQDELNRYFNDFLAVDEDMDPVKYWTNQKTYPTIADFALDYLIIPCSSSSVESLFSHAGFLCSGMRSRISAENLESPVMIKTNFFALK